MNENEDLVSVFTTTNPAIVALVKSLLDNAEIEYTVKGDSLQSVWGSSLTDVVFQVNPDDEAGAREVLKEVSSVSGERSETL